MDANNVNGMVLDNTITWAMIISGIALLSSIISPLITALINNHYQSKLKEKEFSYSTKIKIYHEYIEVTSREILISGISDNYKKIYPKIFLYTPPKIWNKIEELNNIIEKEKSEQIFCNKDECRKILIQISKELNKEI